MIGIYKIINPNGKVYVGQSINLKIREYDYSKLRCKGQNAIYLSLLKYGFEKHKFIIIEICEREELNIRERYWQEQYNSVRDGLNCKYVSTDFQAGYFSKETRLKISKALTGKKLSASHIESLRKAQTGLKRSKEAIKKSALSRTGIKMSDEMKRKLSKSKLLGGNSMAKIMMNTETGIFYNSVKEASMSTNHSYGMFLHCLKGRCSKTVAFIYV